MKELSIEEKAKRYDELKVTAQELEHDGCFDKITLFDLFPELKESEDEMISREITEFLVDFNNGEYERPNENTIDSWLSWLEKQGEQKPAWSEEDEQYVKDTLALLAFGASIHTISQVQDWLNSLKDRVQPKQEWSEEDKRKIGDIRDAITLDDELEESYKEELYNFLKSLRPQNRWKPSDKQMKALKNALDDAIWKYDFKSSPIKEEVTRKHAETIESLYNDLKKLKG